MSRVLFAILTSLFLISCVTNGHEFNSDLSWIKKNQTKQSDVKAIFGEPYKVGNTGGTATWTYGYYYYRLIGESFTKELKLYWNADTTIKDYSFSSSFPEDKQGHITKPK